MHLLSGRARTLESAFGVLILLVLVATAVGVYCIQRDFNMTRFGVSSPVARDSSLESRGPGHEPQVTGQESQFSGLAAGYLSPVGKAEAYNTDNLYEKIDGKAPMYQEAGFVKLTTQRFAAKSDSELGFELYQYDMGSAKNAFSVYSRQKRADGTDLPDMPFAYKTSNAIYISHGKYYIEMIGFAESEELIGAMKGIAEKLVKHLPSGEKDKIVELDIFPPSGTVAGSWKLHLRDAFGFDRLTDTYSAQYKAGEKIVTIFFNRRSNTDDARMVAKNYSDFLVTNGAKAVSVDSEALKTASASVLDFYGSTEIVFSTGRFVAGVHEADNKQAAEKAAEVLIARLKEIND